MGSTQCHGGSPGNYSPSKGTYSPSKHEVLSPHVPPEKTNVSRLCFAAYEGNTNAIGKLLAKGVSVNAAGYDRRTALHVAAAEGHLAALQLLLSSRADVQAVDRWGHSPLDVAVDCGHADVREALLAAKREQGATPRERGDFETVGLASPPVGSSADGDDELGQGMRLCCAAAVDNVQAVHQLLGEGASVNAVDYDSRTALHLAAAHGHATLVGTLLELRADASLEDNFGHTPLSEALSHSRNDSQRAAVMLLNAGNKTPRSERDPAKFMSGNSGVSSNPSCDSSKDKSSVQSHKSNGRISRSSSFSRQPSQSTGSWMIPSSEVKLGEELSRTLKSVIYSAEWRGTKVVAKSLQAPNSSSASSWTLNSSANAVADEDAALPTMEVLHEISLLTTMRHPNLILFLGACLDHSPPFFILEYMDAGDLERHYATQWAKSGHPYRPPLALFLKWAGSVARALCFLHQRTPPVIHRDLKPMNLLLDKNHVLKVADFGISKRMPLDTETVAPRMSGGVGTWRYMAPEVVRYEQYTDKVDIYSFALIMWFMSTGTQPFVEEFGKDAGLVLKEYLKGNEPRPRPSAATLLSGRAAELRQLMQDCWHAEPARRPSAYDCTQIVARTEEFVSSGFWASPRSALAGLAPRLFPGTGAADR